MIPVIVFEAWLSSCTSTNLVDETIDVSSSCKQNIQGVFGVRLPRKRMYLHI